MPNVNLKWTDTGTLEPESDDDLSSRYLLSRQVANEYHSDAVQSYINAESAAQQARAEAAMTEQQQFQKKQAQKKAEGQKATAEFSETMAISAPSRSGELQPAHGTPAAPLQPAHTPASVQTEVAQEMKGLHRGSVFDTGGEAPMVDPVSVAAMGFGAGYSLSRAAGEALMPSLGRALAAGVVNAATDPVYGTAAEMVGAKSPELALPFNLAIGLLGATTLEPAIERGIQRAAQAAGKVLTPENLAEQVRLMRGVLANESGQVNIRRGGADNVSYRGLHMAPSKEGRNSLDNLSDIYPDDIYGPNGARLYGHGGDEVGRDMQSVSTINAYRNHPNKPITIYRAVPSDITNESKIAILENEKKYILKHGKVPSGVDTQLSSSAYYDNISDEIEKLKSMPKTESNPYKINPGDWVTINKSYAADHGKREFGKNYKILSKTVKAKELFTDGNSIHEWGWAPGGVVDDLTKQAVIEEINAEIKNRPIDEALKILKSQKGELVIRPGDEPPAPAPVKGGKNKSGVPATQDMAAKADAFTANKSPDITQEYAGGGNIRLWGGADLEPKFLGQINTPEDIARVISGTDEAFNAERELARRGKQSWADTEAAGRQYKLEDILGRRLGQALNAEQVDNARAMLVSSADSLRGMSQRVMTGQANDLEKADFMRAFNLHYAIQMQLSGAAAEAGRALSIFRKVAQADTMRMGQIQEFLQASSGKVKPEDLAKAISTMETPSQIANFVKQAKRATTWDMFVEAWINGLLSGPVTHAVNTTSNALTSMWMIPERFLASGISKLHGGEIKGGEAFANAYGLIQGAKDGFRLAWQAFKSGESSDLLGKVEQQQNRAITAANVAQLPAIKKLSPNVLEEGGIAARFVDGLGEAIRLPGRFLTAEDELFKAVGYRMELQAQAYRKAAAEGLTGQDMANRMRDIIADPQNLAPEVHAAAVDAARYQTFTKELGPGGSAIQRAANTIPGLKLVIPFIRTPANIMKFAVERTPLAPIMKGVRDDIAAGGARRDMALARMAIGSMAMATVATYAAEGRISGGGPSDSKLRQYQYNQGWQPYSIRIGDSWYSYGRMEPVGMMMGLAADAVEIMGELDEVQSDKVASMLVAAFSKNVMSKTWLRGLSEMVSAMEDPDRYGGQYVKGLAGTVVPTLAAQVERTISPELSDAQSALDAIKARTPGWSKDLPTRRNLWGEKISFNGALGPDLISPIFSSKIRHSPIDKELLRMRVPISMPRRDLTFGGTEHPIRMTPHEYEEFIVRMNAIPLEATGKNLKDSLNYLVSKDPDYKDLQNDDQKESMIKGYIQEAKEKAKQEMYDTNAEIRRTVDYERRRMEAQQ